MNAQLSSAELLSAAFDKCNFENAPESLHYAKREKKNTDEYDIYAKVHFICSPNEWLKLAVVNYFHFYVLLKLQRSE